MQFCRVADDVSLRGKGLKYKHFLFKGFRSWTPGLAGRFTRVPLGQASAESWTPRLADRFTRVPIGQACAESWTPSLTDRLTRVPLG